MAIDSGRRLFAAAACALAVGGVAVAPVASAAPDCTKTAPMTVRCETPGHTQIITSPPPRNFNQWYGLFPYGAFAVGRR